MYATLEGASVKCPSRGKLAENSWQFRYGAYSDLPMYKLGDEIQWHKPVFGEPMKELYAVAYPGNLYACEHCEKETFLVLIHIVENKVMDIEFYKDEPYVPEDVLDANKQ